MTGRLVASLLGALLLALIGLGIGLSIEDAGVTQDYDTWIVVGASLFGLLAGFIVTPFVLLPAFRWASDRFSGVPFEVVFSATLGLLAGLIIAVLIVFAFSVPDLNSPWHVITPALISLTLMALGVAGGASRATQLIPFLRAGSAVDQEAASDPGGTTRNGHCILVDTSAIIDGRIAEITHTGFVDGELLIPRFVLDELQYVADSPDSLKRNRGRRGLDVLNKLQKDNKVDVQIADVEVPGNDGVDSKLISLAKRSNYSLLTTDFNLNKVAELQGIKVLNINDLANSLKPTLIPGEDLTLHITQEGKEESQGVGFLDDGTMVVVEGGSRYLNSQLPVVITRVLQTSAGRIIFAHLK